MNDPEPTTLPTADSVDLLDPATYPNMDQLIAMTPGEKADLLIKVQEGILSTDPTEMAKIASEYSQLGVRLVRVTRGEKAATRKTAKAKAAKPAPPSLGDLMKGL